MCLMIERPGKKLVADDIQKFEVIAGIKLPEDYALFLLKSNGGKPTPDTFKFDAETNNESNLAWLYKLDDLRVDTDDGFAKDFLEIGNDYFGNKIVLCLSGHRTGQVLFWDTEPETFFIENDTVEIKSYLERLSSIDAETESGLTLSTLAIKWARYDILEMLLSEGAAGCLALKAAVNADNLNAVMFLMSRSCNPNDGSPTEPPIVRAAANNNLKMIRVLIEYGANMNAADWRGRTAYRWAKIHGDVVLEKALVELGCDKK